MGTSERPRKHRVFVVEDHIFMREMLASYLGDEPDIEVCSASSSGESALEQIGAADPDLLLVDVSLPGMTGIDLAGVVHERWPKLPCLMLSGHGEDVYVQRAMERGARGYILKGSPEEIPDAVRKVLAGEIYLSQRFHPDQNGGHAE